MNKFIICILFSLTTLVASSQKVYFVYLQSESGQPFFVKMNEKIISSAASGYLILPKLRDSSYKINIGFPQNKWPEQNFAISVAAKDHGYLLKDFGEKGWGLFDLQTLAVQMAVSGTIKSETTLKTDSKDVSAFTDILSKAADDPSLKEKQVQQKVEEKKTEVAVQELAKKDSLVLSEKPKEETKPAETIIEPVVKKEEPNSEIKETVIIKSPGDTEKPVIKRDSSVVAIETKTELKEPVLVKSIEPVVQTSSKEEIKTIPVDEYKKSVVTKKSESSTVEGLGIVFLDEYKDGAKDTIRLLISNPKSLITVSKEEDKEEKKFLEIPADTVKKEQILEVKKASATDSVSTVLPIAQAGLKNSCPAVADGSDFQNLRKNMAAAENDDDMLSVAKAFFKTKCFSVHQLKNLAALFLSDAGKYKFFDMAYAFVTDAENYSSLQNELKEEYYVNRFKAMLRN